jgi:hypothetical protein
MWLPYLLIWQNDFAERLCSGTLPQMVGFSPTQQLRKIPNGETSTISFVFSIWEIACDPPEKDDQA